MSTKRSVDIPGSDVHLEVLVEGDHPVVVLVPSANRDASDFNNLVADLRVAGFDSVCVNLRTIGGSTGPSDLLTLHDLAGDIAAVIDSLVDGPAHLVGHALGTPWSAAAAYHPEKVASVSLLACGGHDLSADPPGSEWLVHFQRCRQMGLTDEERLESIRIAFFAPGNDPRPWLTGWWPDRLDLASVLARSDSSEWWDGGTAPLLIVQPLDDVPGPPRVGRELAGCVGRKGAVCGARALRACNPSRAAHCRF